MQGNVSNVGSPSRARVQSSGAASSAVSTGTGPLTPASSGLLLPLAFSPEDVVNDSEATLDAVEPMPLLDFAAEGALLSEGTLDSAGGGGGALASTPKRKPRRKESVLTTPSPVAGTTPAGGAGPPSPHRVSRATSVLDGRMSQGGVSGSGRSVLSERSSRSGSETMGKPLAAKQLFGSRGSAAASGRDSSTSSNRHTRAAGGEDERAGDVSLPLAPVAGSVSPTSDVGSVSSRGSSTASAASSRQSPDLSRMDEVFEASLTFDLLQLLRLGQGVARMIEVTGTTRLGVLDNDDGSEVDRFDLQLLTGVELQPRQPRPVLQLAFVHALGDERTLRLTSTSDDPDDLQQLTSLQDLLEPLALANQAARANENVALRTKCIACQHVLDAEERRFLVEGHRECPACGSSEVYDLNTNDAAQTAAVSTQGGAAAAAAAAASGGGGELLASPSRPVPIRRTGDHNVSAAGRGSAAAVTSAAASLGDLVRSPHNSPRLSRAAVAAAPPPAGVTTTPAAGKSARLGLASASGSGFGSGFGSTSAHRRMPSIDAGSRSSRDEEVRRRLRLVVVLAEVRVKVER